MIEQLVYVADDNTKFDKKDVCEQHDEMLNELYNIMLELESTPDTCDYANGHGYIQQAPNKIEKLKKKLVALANKYLKEKAIAYVNSPEWESWGGKTRAEVITQIKTEEPHGFNVLGRYLDDGNQRSLYRAWGRFQCMDGMAREWGQPYYALNPEQGEDKKLN